MLFNLLYSEQFLHIDYTEGVGLLDLVQEGVTCTVNIFYRPKENMTKYDKSTIYP